MPLLDLQDFLPIALSKDGQQGSVSLLLYQAIMFAGASFAATRHLRAAGFVTRKAARKTMFHRARVSLVILLEDLI